MASRVRPFIGLTAPVWLGFAILCLFTRHPWLALGHTLVSATAVLCNRAMLWKPRHFRAISHGFCVVGVGDVVVSTMISGQATSPAIMFLAVVPVAVGHHLGRRALIGWTAAALCCVLGVGLSQHLWPLTPIFDRPGYLLIDVVVLIAFNAIVTSKAAQIKEDQVIELESREKTIQKLIDGLELQREELLLANEKALGASRAKSDFLATMSHEIRTPLNGLLGSIDLLQGGEVAPEQRDLLQTARWSGEALLDIINDILDFSKIEAQQLTLDRQPFSLPELLANTVAIFSANARKKGVAVELSISPGVPAQIWGDPGRIRQVVGNLLGNAIKFTEQGRIEIKLAASPAASPADIEIECAVIDTGVGIPPEKLSLLFQPFSQLTAGTTGQSQGTGLGLAISQRLARLMKGRVEVKSQLGVGSEFSFFFRAEEATEPARSIAAPPDQEGKLAEQSPLRILLVEDNPINQKIARLQLRKLGYQIETASDGFEAVAMASGGAFDLVLMDVRLPGLDGLEATRRIRQAPAPRQPRIVAMTANVTVEDRAACLEAGMDDFVSKPILQAELRRVLLAASGAMPAGRPR